MRAKRLLLGAALALAIAPRGARSGEMDPGPDDTAACTRAPRVEAPIDVGPRVQSAPPGAFVARDEAELAAWIADPRGPRDVWLAPRTYRGDLVIRRPIAIHGTRGATLEGTRVGTVVTIEADDVVVEDVAVRASGRRNTIEDAGIHAKGTRIRVSHVDVADTLFGVSFGICASCTLEGSRVTGDGDVLGMRGDGIKVWESPDAVVRGNFVDSARDVVVWYSRRATVENNVVAYGRYGTHFMYAHDGVARNNRLMSNVVGIFVMYSTRMTLEDNVLAGGGGAAGVGAGFKESDDVVLRGNQVVANTAGFYVDRTPRSPEHPVKIERNVLALNQVALRLHSSENGVDVTDCDFHGNVVAAEVDGGGDALGVHFKNNHWSDYAGYDLDGDGFGDVAFEVKKLSADMKDAHPSLRLFEGTLAMGMIDAIAEATPVFASRRLLVDPTPRMRPLPTRIGEESR